MGRKAYETFTCSCGERCVMVPHERTGKLAPITTTAYENGNIALVDDHDDDPEYRYRIVPKDERQASPAPRYLNHWSNCPDAESFRR